METKRRNKFLTILLTAIAVSLLLICCYANLLPQEQLTRMTPYSFTDDWTLSSREETRMMALGEDFHVQGNTLHLFRRLPEFLNADDVLMFRTSLIALSVRIDGEEIYHYDGTGALQSLTMKDADIAGIRASENADGGHGYSQAEPAAETKSYDSGFDRLCPWGGTAG